MHRLFKIALPIAGIFSTRMLGLFMLIPIFTLYANQLTGATPQLIGIALGSYGLSQGLLQIPFGLLSDKYGRKPIISIGLLLFGIGSILGAFTHHIYGIIVARILQGMGAIGSVLIALLADLTTEKERTMAMAIIGGSIGLSFTIAFIISPILAKFSGLKGIFYASTFLVILAYLLLYFAIEKPPAPSISQESISTRLKHVFKNQQLGSLNFGIFCQHFLLTSIFFYLPLQLNPLLESHHIDNTWGIYLPILIISFFMILPIIHYSEKKKLTKITFMTAISLTIISQYFFLSDSLPKVVISLFLYFVCFNLIEAMLPSLISKCAPKNNKGAAMGVYSSCQFLGIFAGGTSAGISYSLYGSQGIFMITSIIGLLWLFLTYKLFKPEVYNQ